jgi:hypothetical protein
MGFKNRTYLGRIGRMNTRDKKCHDCGHTMKAIRITDYMGEPIKYTVADAKRSFLRELFPVKGKVAACMCDGCGRILLYGELHRPKKPEPTRG